MRKVLLLQLIICATVFSQLDSYVNKTGSELTANECGKTIIVAPKITAEILGGNFDSSELKSARFLLSKAVSDKIKNSTIIEPENLNSITNCESKVIVIKLMSYHKEPARLGQFRGFITIQILFFQTPKSPTPESTQEFSDHGGVHWGDSEPFFKAVNSICSKIKWELKKQE
jgi:hypothetical protein